MLRGSPGAALVAFWPDGQTVAAASGNDKTDVVTLWDAKTNEIKRRVQGNNAKGFAFAFSPDGATVASGSYVDNTVRLWKIKPDESKTADRQSGPGVRSGRASAPESILEVGGLASAVAFSPDGDTVASDGVYAGRSLIVIWDARSGAAHGFPDDFIEKQVVHRVFFRKVHLVRHVRSPGLPVVLFIQIDRRDDVGIRLEIWRRLK